QVASWPDSVHAYIGLGYVRQAKGDSAGAEANYRAAIRRDPAQEEGFLRLFQLLASRERWDEAKAVLVDWSNAHPENADVRSELSQFDQVVESRKKVGTAIPKDQN
ncbi:MAG: tetratricopeptide repeat protein, partial [Gemmatimonadetes bacterium]|nr:tetratricopeptide repeat protein [Gemmatimonadota bacterium]